MTIDEARAAAAKGNNAANLELAALLLDDYDPSGARAAIDRYRAKLPRGAKPAPEADDLEARIELMQSMLDRVENIQVIDSLIVDADDFFRHYRLSAPTGSIVGADMVVSAIKPDVIGDAEIFPPAYIPESATTMFWSMGTRDDPDSRSTMWQSDLLADGSWDTPRPIFSVDSIFGDTNPGGDTLATPFMMTDGTTLYFAANGAASIGGLDIFITRADDNSYLQPQNIGMPYNSPADDYMLAIDELTGVGWWATDRNHIPGKVTIYRFIPSDLRVNYSPDTPGLADLARISSVALTHIPATDYDAIKARIDSIPAAGAPAADDLEFTLSIPGIGIYTSLDDFKSENARSLMEQYLDTWDDSQLDLDELADLRLAWRNGDHSVASQIRSLEAKTQETARRLRSLQNSVIKAESKASRQQ